jgi:hypothetical protein
MTLYSRAQYSRSRSVMGSGCGWLFGFGLRGIVSPWLGEVVRMRAVELVLDRLERLGDRLIAPGLVVADRAAGDAVRLAFGDPAQGRQHCFRLVGLEQQLKLLPQAFFLLFCQYHSLDYGIKRRACPWSKWLPLRQQMARSRGNIAPSRWAVKLNDNATVKLNGPLFPAVAAAEERFSFGKRA